MGELGTPVALGAGRGQGPPQGTGCWLGLENAGQGAGRDAGECGPEGGVCLGGKWSDMHWGCLHPNARGSWTRPSGTETQRSQRSRAQGRGQPLRLHMDALGLGALLSLPAWSTPRRHL